MRPHQLLIMPLRLANIPPRLVVQLERNLRRRREVVPDFDVRFGRRVVVGLGDGGEDVFVETEGGRSVHAGVFT